MMKRYWQAVVLLTLAITHSCSIDEAYAQVILPYSFSSGTSIQSSQVNANFTAVANEINSHENAFNPHNTTLAEILSTGNSCGSTSIDFNDNQALNMEVEHLSSDPSAGNAGRLFINTTTHLLKFDDGSAINTVGGSGSNNLDSVLNSGNSAGAHNIDVNENQLLHARVENQSSAPSAGNAGRLYWNTGATSLNVDTGSAWVAVGGAQGLSSVLGVSNSAGSTNIDFNSNQAKNMVLDKLSSDPGSPVAGQLWYNTTSHIPKFYNGTSSLAVGNTNTLAQTVALGATTGADIDLGGHQAQHLVVWNNSGSPGTGTAGEIWYDTGTSSLNYETSGSNHRVCSLDGTETLTNKTIDGGSNTLTNIGDGSLSANVDLLNSAQTISAKKIFSSAPQIAKIKTAAGTTSGHTIPDGLSDDTFALLNATQTFVGKTLSGVAITGTANFNENQATNFRVENRSSDPTPGNAGRVFYKTTTGELLYDDGSNIHALAASSGGASFTEPVSITGSSDHVQLTVQGNATQTNDIFDIIKSNSTNLFKVDNSGNATAFGTLLGSNLAGTNTGDLTLAAFGSTPATNGASLSGQVLTLQPADATHGGGVSTGTQTFAGAKTFSSTIVGSVNGNAATVTTNANLTGPITSVGNATSIASQTGTGTTFVMSAGPTLTGTLTASVGAFSSTLTGSTLSTLAGGAVTANGDNVIVTGSDSKGFVSKNASAVQVGFIGPVKGFTGAADTTDLAIASFGSNLNLYSNNSSSLALQITSSANVVSGFGVASQGYDTSTATSGTITASANKPGLSITGAGGTTLIIKLPSSPVDGQQYWVASAGNFTTVTWQDAGGTAGNVIGGQASLGGTARGQRFVYISAQTKWFSIG